MLVRKILRIFTKLFGNKEQNANVFKVEANEEIQLRLDFYFKTAEIQLKAQENQDSFVSCMLLCPITKQIIEREVCNKFQRYRLQGCSNQYAAQEAFSVATKILKNNPSKPKDSLPESISTFCDELGASASNLPLRKLKV